MNPTKLSDPEFVASGGAESLRLHMERLGAARKDVEKQVAKVTVRVDVYSGRGHEVQGLLVDFREWLDGVIAGIPDEHLSGARIDIETESSYDVGYSTVDVYYERPETDSEQMERESAEARRISNQRANDLRQLAALKAKYEGKA